jgi:hypothetical protein
MLFVVDDDDAAAAAAVAKALEKRQAWCQQRKRRWPS